MTMNRMEEQIAAMSALGDPTRRRLYFFVVSRPEGAGREEAAKSVGVTRALAAFHLDRLLEDGLLVTEYRRLTGRSGPGAGRPAKIYRRSPRQLAVTLPQRNYELLARLLAQALIAGDGASSLESLTDAAYELGTTLGARAREEAGSRPGRDRLLAAAAEVLADCGYEPARDGRCLRLGNCPFSPLSGEFTAVVCQMNVALMQGMVDGMRIKGVEAALDPDLEHCCVVLRPAPRRAPETEAALADEAAS
jgi:predicted ArsR family transcriptional regulator